MADFNEIISLLNELHLKKKGQSLDNISDLAKKTYNWTAVTTVEQLEKAEKENVIKKWTVNNCISYHLAKDVVHIVDSNDSIATQTDQVNNVNNDIHDFQSNFIEFKEYVFKELNMLKSTCSCKYASPAPENERNESLVIQCLKSHISSLERQLSDKQKTIDSLLVAKNIGCDSGKKQNDN